MKSLVVIAAGLALITSADADAAKHKAKKSAARATTTVAKKSERKHEKPRGRVAATTKKKSKRAKHPRIPMADLGPAPGQSVGAPWMGRLQDPAKLPEGDRYVIRRPSRAFGTKAAVDVTKRVIDQILEDFPEAHVLAVGDMSSEHGGRITQHVSHQSGRDIDLGLFYKAKPGSYPADFVGANADNIDFATTFAMIDTFGDSETEDGGVQMMFLDYRVQGLLYEWAKAHEVEVEHLDHLFQYPHGKGAANGVVRHEPNHDNHVHVRFKCPSEDTGCQY